MFIELNEFKSKYNISDMSNEKLVRMAIEKEFPEFDEFHIEWSIEDIFIKIDFHDKEKLINDIEIENNEKYCKDEIIKLINFDDTMFRKIESQSNISREKFIEICIEKLKAIFGSYSVMLSKLRNGEFIKEVTTRSSYGEKFSDIFTR